MNAYRILPTLLLILIFVGCSPLPSTMEVSPSRTQTVSQPQEGATSSSGNSNAPINTPDFSALTTPAADINPFVSLVEKDLANRLQVGLDQIHFLKITDLDWQDIQQGCTTPMGQTQNKGRVSGYRIWLEANGKNYLYHIGLDNTIVFCTEQQ